MQKWEYCWLRVGANANRTVYFQEPGVEWLDNDDTVFEPPIGTVTPVDKKEAETRLYDTVTKLGLEGWELVSVGENSKIWYFKRPIKG